MKTKNTERNRRKLIDKLESVNSVLRHAEQFIKDHLQENETAQLANIHAVRHTVVKLQETILHM